MLEFHLFLVELIQLFPVFFQIFLITVVFIVTKELLEISLI